MSDFIDNEAEESSDEEAILNKKRKVESDEEAEAVVPTRRRNDDDDEEDEEEEDDEDKLREEMKDLINDDEEEEEEDDAEVDSDEDVGRKRRKRHDDYDDALEDEDYDLIEENLGVKVQRKKKFKRLRRIEDDEESDAEESRDSIGKQPVDDREAIANELFERSDAEAEGGTAHAGEEDEQFKDISESEAESDPDDFIVDDDGQPITKGKRKRHVKYTDAALQEAQDIFGVDFDYNEFEHYGEEYEEDIDDEEYEEEEEEGETRPRPKRSVQKRPTKKSIFDVFEPSELERGHFTDLDNEIRVTDIPERFQLRGIPVTQAEDDEIEEEADWIYKQAFSSPTISIQNPGCQREEAHHPIAGRKAYTAVPKIREALKFMRNHQFEVILNCYLYRLKEANTMEELRDVCCHFKLYYSQDLAAMRESADKKQPKEVQKEVENQENEKEEGENENETENDASRIKLAARKDAYAVCREAGLDGLAKKFGLTPEHFGENLRDNYQRHEVDQYPIGPLEVAGDFVSKRFPTAEDALRAARFVVATQISCDPVVRKCVRQTYFERAKINIKPTKKGIKEVDENHPCYTMKYLKNKPLKDLVGDQFLRLIIAEDEGLLTIQISMHRDDGGPHVYLDEIKQLYYRDEFSKNVQEWNGQRYQALEIALTKFLYPLFEKEMRARLLLEAKEGIIKFCCRKLYNWLKMAPYQVEQGVEEDEDYDTREGIRVLGVAYLPDWEVPAFGAMIDGSGEVTDYLRLPHLLKRKNAWREKERAEKESVLQALRKFIIVKKPHVVAVGGESREALMIVDDIKAILNELMESEQMPAISVELVDNELATVYMNSKKGEMDFRDYPPLLRQAISLARRLQDPLIEFSQLCSPDEEIICLKYHQLQEHIPREDLLNALYLEFVNRTNEVGVDINQAIAHPHTSHLVQFVCGLGPRKGGALLKNLKQTHQRLESRTQLVTVCRMGPKVFINCAGFIKIDTSSLGDSTETYVEVLDGSRVHPEAYEWARKMAVDALEYDDTSEDVNPAGALEEILENPEKLKDLDLDAFAEELERQGFGNKSITLYDIRAELNYRYKDLRTPYRPSSAEETFNMLTKETPHTFYIGKLVLVQVVGIARKKPQGEQLDQANPIRNDETGLWQCPFCLKNDFPELSEVWNHFDAGSCPGQAMGVRVRLDNGISGFIPTKMISDKRVTDPEERVKIGMTLHCRITKIDIERFAVDVTCRSSDLADKNNEWRPTKDLYYDYDSEDKDRRQEEELQKRQNRQTYIKRVIVHPSFHNISFKEAEKILANMEQGEVIIRPSSKGADHLTVTWKVHDGINQHIDVREEGKENAFSLGQSLWINNEEFEDLDEIIARYVQPMALHARDLINFKYFRDAKGGKREALEELLLEEKKKAPSKIHYFVSACKVHPGTFVLSYLPRNKVRHEYIKVTAEGFRYRQQVFHSINSLFRWFKEHFRDPVATTPGAMTARTPLGQSSYIGTTPSINVANVDPQAIQRAAANLPSHVFNTLSQVAGQTPGFQSSNNFNSAGYSGSGFNFQPYTPSQPIATPMVTPSYHAATTPAHSVTTPRYPQTPQNNWNRAAQTPRAQTPSHHGASTPGGPNKLPSNPSAADWKRMAEQWAKNRREETRMPRARHARNTNVSPSPMIESTPAADSTPLIDEQ
ncbi:transcription elongation factor SPT6-like [Centruroides sculpturatus]|uniref:transcription elongation factor SPT6-like n=1 Tax=Centruroides sculpturatus TaxID=218467 RepID=UPI000C6CDBA7|nr:transcription elongation factor SPT6-like [Centruroides sculpturatus]